jgi:hypothetical protein
LYRYPIWRPSSCFRPPYSLLFYFKDGAHMYL